MLYIGIDPGRRGAQAVLHERGEIVDLRDMVVASAEPLTARMREVGVVACVEYQQAFPRMAVAAAVRIVGEMRWWEGVFAGQQISCVRVRPKEWQRVCGGGLPKGGRARKRAINEWAQRRWPAAELRGPEGAVLDGRSDALCIAEHCRRMFVGK